MYTKLDRQVTYDDIEYVVIEVLQSDMLLVVEKEVFDRKEYPMTVKIIPENL